MKKLTRKWQKTGDDNFSLPMHDDGYFHPMDSLEQEALVRSFEKNQAHQNLIWRRVFAVFLFTFVAFQIYSIYHQAFSPWELRHHAYFMEDIASWIVISADWMAVLACSMSIVGLLHSSKNHRQWIWYSCYTGIILAMFWLYFMLRIPKFRWDVIWLPFGPLSGAGICLYIDHLLTQSSEEVRKLRSYMYAYKAS
ncbi:hypothetical protein CFOL_v3_05703 [Cephalotus follicularis]|uniref:Uncharacterized protein n=1 Tax=Cephalotus follicularis TaxID=3775 RepID=A0A1Q3B2I7_CEPFO|nr:hypothetical protein CFOL_v3_05703 [Cephalotus follicularis]